MSELAAALRRIGTRQIGGVAVIFRPGVDQKTQGLGRRLMIQLGVVQHRSVLVQRHDVVVRHIGIAVAGSRQVGQIDVELAHAGEEGLMRGTMAGYRRLLRFAHAGQLIAGFNRTVEIQVVQHRFRVDVFRRDAEIAGALLGITDIADALTLRRQLLRDRIGVGQRHQFEGLGPETVRQRLYAVPVVNRGVEPQLRLVDAIYPQPADVPGTQALKCAFTLNG
ncbi:Uncharacterised protein [Acinetobacter baumannii]|nr:Uncharacterised protein [Acinetobacter baumannii]